MNKAVNTSGLKILKELWPFLSPYKKVLLTAGLVLIFTVVLNLSLGQAVRLVIDRGFVDGSLEQLNQILLVFFVVVILMALGAFIRFYLVTWLGERVTADLRIAVFNHLITLEPSYFETNRSGELMSRLTTDTTLLQSIIGSSISFALRSSLMMIGGLVMMLLTSAKFTLIVFCSLPFVVLPIVIFGKRVRKLSRASQDTIADIGTFAGEILEQIKTVQSYTREENERLAFGQEVKRSFDVAKSRILNRALLTSTVIFFAFFSIGIMIYIGTNSVIDGSMSGGELGAFIFYAVLVASGITAVSEVLGELQRAAGATERLLELLHIDPVIKSPKIVSNMQENAIVHVRFNQVSFAYPSRPEVLALENISLDIQHGETVAVVGTSGAGKSTLFELLQRFYDPQQGEILLNGTRLKDLELSVARGKMAMVPQQPTLFSADVFHNIAYGKPEASEIEIIAAAKSAHASDFIQSLPDQYKSFLGERGVRLSGGQKQRIVIARAILNNPEILLLDEATSALDSESEFWVQQALQKLMKDRTTIIIAHRLATIVHADRILVMEAGQVIAQGSHQELLSTSDLYKKLAALQFGHQDKAM